MASVQGESISSTFIWRRVHSLMGFWLVLYLFEHLIVNSQAALWIGDDGIGFIHLVNILESLPYLQVIETVLIGFPLAIHGIWGIKRALQARCNSSPQGGKAPHLPYGRNRAFTWQRLSSWILLFGIIGHVIQMRFVETPLKVMVHNQNRYLTKITFDEGLYTLAPRLGVHLYSKEEILNLETVTGLPSKDPEYVQELRQQKEWEQTLRSYSLKDNQLIAASPSMGIAMLLMVRNTFKIPLMVFLYTIFVLAACFHAFHGFWTFLITWGVILSYRSQKAMIRVSVVGMILLSFLGLAAIWGSYFINLKQ